ncbi:MAG: hypothetical protein IKW04_03535 [Clostridia bacterium]|nr:hypothetical protein [Clostridia bacterium]
MKLKIANLHIEITGDLNPLFIERVTPYQDSFFKADISIHFRLQEHVELPKDYQLITVTNDRTWATLPMAHSAIGISMSRLENIPCLPKSDRTRLTFLSTIFKMRKKFA